MHHDSMHTVNDAIGKSAVHIVELGLGHPSLVWGVRYP